MSSICNVRQITKLFRSVAAIVSVACCSAVSAAVPAELSAQYFGRNKVQYENFDFRKLQTEHFDIYYYASEAEAVRTAARMAERWYERLSTLLDHEFDDRQPLILYASHPHFRQTNVIPGMVGPGTGGVTEPFKRRIVLPFASSLGETDHVLGHELVHAFQFDMAGGAMGRLPLWFVEGMAEYLSLGPNDAQTAMWMRDATRAEQLPTIRKLASPRFFPYRYGHALWAFLAGTYGDSVVRVALENADRGPLAAIASATNLPIDTLSSRWHQAIRRHYATSSDSITRDRHSFTRLITPATGGEQNLAPALSPDGSRLMFLSEKSQFGLELFLADATSGEVIRQVTEFTFDSHFESLEFIGSSGAWTPDGERFTVVGVSKGQPVLATIDVASGDVVRELRFPRLGQIFNPTWSPDGRIVAFTGLQGGQTDLYTYDVEHEYLRQLTNDPSADLHPAWSPNGERLAFVTDRFTSHVDAFLLGEYRLAIINVATGRIEELELFPTGKAINPQWSADGSRIYFVADPTGVPNVYNVTLSTNIIRQVTNLFTGVSGITALSPAVSIAREANKLAFSAREDNGYLIYATGEQALLDGVMPMRPPVAAGPATLPPLRRADAQLRELLANATIGLPDDTTYDSDGYTPGLSLDYIAQPTLVAGADQSGAFIGGGTALFFSDMLAQHRLATAFQIQGSLENVSAAVAYQNQANRVVWGGTVERVPFTFGAFDVSLGIVDGDTAIVEREHRLRQTNLRATGTLWYPFSQVLRAEFAAGYRRISFEEEIETIALDPRTGGVLSETTEESTPFDALNLGTGTVALVYDNTFFGATSPIRGQRYRLDATPTLGSLNYVEILGDYRRYVMPWEPFTFAVRALHFGRYGPDADDDRIQEIYLGFPGLIRGYSRASFEVNDCTPTENDPCPEFNQLFGTRVAVLNAEVRFPLLGVLGVGEGFYGGFPLEAGVFTDVGVAWRDGQSAFFLGGERDPVVSAGLMFRANLGGFLIIQFDVARSFQRDRWVTQFNFLPGF